MLQVLLNMDTRSYSRRALKSAQEQEDRYDEEVKDTESDVLQRQHIKGIKVGGRGIMPGSLLKLLVKNKLLHSGKVPVKAG